jgi:LysW-gamma-L-lysine carboxypeptidase
MSHAPLDPVLLLQTMLRTPSLSGDEAVLAFFLANEMERLGLQGRVDAAGNAVGELGNGPTVVLLGHIDTVPGVVPVRIEDGKLYGRGAVDAKGPFATFISAAARLVANPPPFRLVLVGAVEEEAASSKGAHFIVDQYQPVACIIGEPSGWDKLTLGYKGRLLVEGHWEQPMAHSAGKEIAVAERAVAFWNTLAAYCTEFNVSQTRLYDQLLPALRSFNTHSDGLTDCADLLIGVRLPPAISPDELAATIATWDSTAHLRFRDSCRAYSGEKNTPLVRALLKGIRSAGGTPSFLLKTGTSDMNVVGPAWQCPILAYGPGDSSLDHTPNEHIEINEYLRAIDVLETALRAL